MINVTKNHIRSTYKIKDLTELVGSISTDFDYVFCFPVTMLGLINNKSSYYQKIMDQE